MSRPSRPVIKEYYTRKRAFHDFWYCVVEAILAMCVAGWAPRRDAEARGAALRGAARRPRTV